MREKQSVNASFPEQGFNSANRKNRLEVSVFCINLNDGTIF